MIFRHFKMLLVAACALAVSGPALGQVMELNNGLTSADDGYLEVNVDAYGSYASAGFGGGGDLYNPIGGGPQMVAKEAAFSSGFFLFNGKQRELLSENGTWQAVGTPDFADDTSLDREILSPTTMVNGSLVSQFRVFGGDFDVIFDLTQSLSPPVNRAHGFTVETVYGDGDGSTLYQTYVATTNNGLAQDFQMVRAQDGDLLWSMGGAFGTDEAGTMTHADDPPGVTSSFQQNASPPNGPASGTRFMTRGNNNGGAYYGGVQGVDPGGAGVPYGFGTDVQVWDNFGVPTNWRNNIANVGYDTDGLSGAPGGGMDTFHGLEFNVSVIPEPSCLALCSLLGMGLLAFRRRLS